MDRLAEIVRREVFWYAGGGPNLKVIPFANEDEQAHAVAIVAAGIPRDKIVLAYAGEPIPEGA